MEEKISWEKISELYDKEWVQLVDYEWLDEEALPRSGVVAAHARSRKEFDELICNQLQKSSAVVYVGERDIPEGVFFSANLHQWKPCCHENL